MSTDRMSPEYRGEGIESFTFLSASCHICDAPAFVQVVRHWRKDFGGTIATYYCKEHMPPDIAAHADALNRAARSKP